MLQCSGCGGLVSEFAARCSACGREVPPPEVSPYLDEADGSAPFIADAAPGPGRDEAPPLRPKRSRRPLALGLVAALMVGGVTVGLWLSSGPPPGRAQGLASLYGRIVAHAPDGAAVSYDPAARRTAVFSLPGAPVSFVPVALSPDGTTWLGSSGTVVTLVDGRVASSRSVDAAPGLTTAVSFADGDRGIVLVSAGTASMVDLSNGHHYTLGPADTAAGDPQTLGAFVTTPADVELRGPGRGPAILATASQLDQDVGWASNRPVRLGVYPSPTGDAVAVVVAPLTPVHGDTPLVVLNRAGGVLAAIDEWNGPMYGSQPVWSPGAHQIAYPTYTTSGPALAIGTETGAVGTVAAPVGTVFGRCVWSVSSTDVACQAWVGSRSRWVYGIPTADRLLSSDSPGAPVAWIAAPPP